MSSELTCISRLFQFDSIPFHLIDQLIDDNGVIFKCDGQAPSPDKDYAQVMVTKKEVIFRFWRISLRKNGSALPVEKRQSHDDFLYDERLQSEVHRIFGSNMLVYMRGLASGHIDYLPRLPQSILIYIIRILDLEDIGRLGQTCKMFNNLCNSNDLWESIYKDHTRKKVSVELFSLAMAIGWRKLFFTNKIQLQMQVRRMSFMSGSAPSTVEEGESGNLWDLRPASIMSMQSTNEAPSSEDEKEED